MGKIKIWLENFFEGTLFDFRKPYDCQNLSDIKPKESKSDRAFYEDSSEKWPKYKRNVYGDVYREYKDGRTEGTHINCSNMGSIYLNSMGTVCHNNTAGYYNTR